MDRYEYNEYQNFDSLVVLKSVTLTESSQQVQQIQSFINEEYEYNHLIPICGFQSSETLFEVLFVPEKPGKSAGSLIIYIDSTPLTSFEEEKSKTNFI